ncbi:TPA: hypothetical protein SLG40_001575 [Serratia odorifera]|nr:hypothetical protein [Serratia odorifera]
MALVKVISNNLYGANFQKLEVGSEVEVADAIASRWAHAGHVTLVEKKQFEVATPSKSKKKD